MMNDQLVKTTPLRIIYKGGKWDTFRLECCTRWIVMNHRCEVRRREREGEWDVGTFWGPLERDKVRTRGWVIVQSGLQEVPLTSSQAAGVELTSQGVHTSRSHESTLLHVNSSCHHPLKYVSYHIQFWVYLGHKIHLSLFSLSPN